MFRLLSSFVCLISWSAPAHATDPAPSEAPAYSLIVNRISLRDLIEEIAAVEDKRVKFSDTVRGSVSDLRLKGDPADMLDEVTEIAALDWYEFGGTIFVSRVSERQNQLIRSSFDVQKIEALLNQNLPDVQRFNLRRVSENMLSLSAPETLVELTEGFAQSVSHEEIEQRKIKVRRGLDETFEAISQD